MSIDFFTSFLELICLRYEYAHFYICKIVIIIIIIIITTTTITIISACVYVPSILHHWACISISEGHFIEYVCRWEFVCELSKTLHSLFSLCHICCLEWDMSNLLLKALGHCPFHHYIHCWCDFPLCLIWVDHHSFSYVHCFAIILVITSDLSSSFHPLFFSYSDLFQDLILSLHHSYESHYQFDFLHCLIIVIMFILGILRSMAHEIFLYMLHFIHIRAWVLIIGCLDLVSLHFCYPITLAYITSCVLRPPWGHEIRCRLQQPLLRQMFEIWLIFRCHHASSSRRRLFYVWI